MADQYVQRTGAEYADAIANELPQGAAWPRDPDSNLMAWCRGSAMIWGDAEQLLYNLLFVESDPRYAEQMLTDWETAFGLPDPCVKRTLSLQERHTALVNKMTTVGGASRQFFISLAKALGYTITIKEYVPFQCGISSCGGSHGALYGPDARFYWTVTVDTPRIARFQCGYSCCGRDSLLAITRAEDLECVFNRWKPAHTNLIFSYVTHDSTFEFFFKY